MRLSLLIVTDVLFVSMKVQFARWDVQQPEFVVLTLDEDGTDEVIGMICIKNPQEETIMVISENGYGKRSDIEDYRKTNRGGKGVRL